MKIKGNNKNKKRRRFHMIKTKQKSKMDYMIDFVENNSSNDWNELCDKCSSLIKDAKMTDADINRIVKDSKKE